MQRKFLFVSSQTCINLPVFTIMSHVRGWRWQEFKFLELWNQSPTCKYYSTNLLYLTITYQLKVNMMNNDIEFPFYNREGLFIVGIPYLIYLTFLKHFPSMGPYKCFTTIPNLDVDFRPNALKVYFIQFYCIRFV